MSDICDRVFSPLTRNAPLPFGKGETLWPQPDDLTFEVKHLEQLVWSKHTVTGNPDTGSPSEYRDTSPTLLRP